MKGVAQQMKGEINRKAIKRELARQKAGNRWGQVRWGPNRDRSCSPRIVSVRAWLEIVEAGEGKIRRCDVVSPT